MVNIFQFLKLFFWGFVVSIFDLVHNMGAIFDLP